MWNWNDRVAAMAIEERHREADRARLVRESRRGLTQPVDRPPSSGADAQEPRRSGRPEHAVSPLAATGDR